MPDALTTGDPLTATLTNSHDAIDSPQPLADVLAEAQRIMASARTSDVPLWLAGGAGIQLHCVAMGGESALARIPVDIDIATGKRRAKPVTVFFEHLGYRPNMQFNALNGRRRLLFYDDANSRQVDVFVGTFEMCHTVPLVDRVDGFMAPGLLPAAELLLTKLQIVELTAKDLQDILNLLLHMDVTDGDDRTINGSFIGELCARDWGLWRTCALNLDRVTDGVSATELDAVHQAEITERLGTLRGFIDRALKTRHWRVRSRLGDRVRWYDEPEEIGGAVPVTAVKPC